MNDNWEQITSDLYGKIKPISGRLFSQIDSTHSYKKKLGNVWIEFDMNEFDYFDPFYGEQKSTASFKIEISLWDYIEPLNIDNISNLENLVLTCEAKDRIGAFSNSLHFTVPTLKFGRINNNQIKIFLEYSLTNSESYGYMTGTIDDHIQKKGKIEVKVDIKDLQLLAKDYEEAKSIAKTLNQNFYDSENLNEATDLHWSSPNYKCYYVKRK